MKAIFKYALAFTAGAGCGAGGCYILLRKQFEVKAEQAIDEVREHAKLKLRALEKERDDAYSLIKPNEIKDEDGSNKRDKPRVRRPGTDRDGVDYTQFYTGNETPVKPVMDISADALQKSGSAITYVKGLDEKLAATYEAHKDIDDSTGFSAAMAGREYPRDDEPEDEETEEERTERESREYNDYVLSEDYEVRRAEDIRPYPIMYSEMQNQRGWYDKLSFSYYEEDHVLTDDAGEPVSEAEYLFPGWEDLWGTNEDDPDVIYVRNPAKGMDYEVCRIAEAYSDNHVVED